MAENDEFLCEKKNNHHLNEGFFMGWHFWINWQTCQAGDVGQLSCQPSFPRTMHGWIRINVSAVTYIQLAFFMTKKMPSSGSHLNLRGRLNGGPKSDCGAHMSTTRCTRSTIAAAGLPEVGSSKRPTASSRLTANLKITRWLSPIHCWSLARLKNAGNRMFFCQHFVVQNAVSLSRIVW